MYNYRNNDNDESLGARKKSDYTTEEVRTKNQKDTPVKDDIPAKVINCDRLNIRAKPDFSAPVIATITEGSRITITDTPNEKFYAIKTTSGIIGYCAQHFIKIL